METFQIHYSAGVNRYYNMSFAFASNYLNKLTFSDILKSWRAMKLAVKRMAATE